jgi:purine-cytosine permease-like protein
MKYLYYKQYQFNKSVGTDSQPEIPSFIFISIIQAFYLNEFLFLINYFIVPFELGILESIGLFIVMIIINHFYLYKKRDKIFSHYKGESKSKSIIGFALLFLFIVCSLALMPLLIHFYGFWK